MAVTDEQWQAFLTRARLDQPAVVPPTIAGGVVGRFISVLVDKLVEFWAKHRDTLVPVLTQLAIAALDALVSARADIDRINLPGPE